MRFLKKLLLGVYIFTGVFTAVSFTVFALTGIEASTLTACVFGVAGIESMLSAVIKSAEEKSKVKEEKSDGCDNLQS